MCILLKMNAYDFIALKNDEVRKRPALFIRSGSLLIALLHGKGVETAVHHGHRAGDKSRRITDEIVYRAT